MTQDTLFFLHEQERLRQRAKAFDHDLKVRNRKSILQTAVGWSSIVIFGTIAAVSAVVLLNHTQYAREVVAGAIGAFFVDAFGLVLTIVKFVFKTEEHPSAQALINVQPATSPAGASQTQTPSISAEQTK